MPSLTSAALFSKKAFFWSLVAIAAVVALVIFLGIGRSIKNALFAPKPLPATVAFGKLPSMDLAGGYKAPAGGTYSLETISGDFPSLPHIAKVFAIGKAESSFGALERIKIKAENLGFRDEPTETSPGVFKFVDAGDGERILTIDSDSENFTLESDYFSDTEVLGGRPQSEQRAIEMAVDFLNDYGLDLVNYPKDRIETRKLRIDGSVLTETPALSTANIIEVNFIRGALDEIPVFPAAKNKAGISVLVSQNKVVSTTVNPPMVLAHKFATYPLRPAALAFEDLKKGLASFNKPITTSQVTIIDVSLGYVESEVVGDFLIPVYILRGVDDLWGFTPAVDEVWFDGASTK
ncbi:hypothetical protein HYZ70_00835 [Candidatus Curtissbacteria bacterium]|nr:hypothetical protein [Candidatus Curtissbacteria bacterium]